MAIIRLSDIPAGHDGNAKVTISGIVYPAFKISKINPRVEIIKDTKQFLEERAEQNAVRGAKQLFDMDYYMQSMAMIQAVETYLNGGDYPDISIQYYAKSKKYGRMEILLTGIIMDSIGLGLLDDTSNSAQIHSTAGSFDKFEPISRFKE